MGAMPATHPIERIDSPMTLPYTVDSIDTIPEAHRGLYKEAGGKFTLDISGMDDPVGLKSALTKEREAVKLANRQAAQWTALGKTPDEIAALLALQATAESDKLAQAGEWDKLRKQQTDLHDAAIATMTQAGVAKDLTLSKHLIDSAAVSAIAANKGSSALLLPLIRGATKVVNENGVYAARVIDEAGTPRVNSKGEFLSINDLVSEMRQDVDLGRAFEPSGTTGSGASGGGGGSSLKSIASTDKASIGANLADIASGKIKVT